MDERFAVWLEFLTRLGSDSSSIVAREVTCAGGTVDVVWFDPKLPLAAVTCEPVDIREAPVLPIVAFVTNTADASRPPILPRTTACIEATAAPLRVFVIARAASMRRSRRRCSRSIR